MIVVVGVRLLRVVVGAPLPRTVAGRWRSMGELPKAMAERLPAGTVQLETAVRAVLRTHG